MTDKFEEIDKAKNSRPLTASQKFLFGMICWGIQTWSQVESFKKNGYDQKYSDAKKAIRIGMFIYGAGIFLFVAFLLIKYIRQ